MANSHDIDFTYTTIDKLFRLSMGQTGDYSGAMYNGDFALSLEEAQLRKHEFIAEQLHISKGTRLLDIGCGWGGFLTYVQTLGAKGQGVTLSRGQAKACNSNGLQVTLMDARQITSQYQGTFDAVTCIGGMEHLCSIEQWQAGKQDKIYADFFNTVAALLPIGGRFYMQTMVFGPNQVPFEEISLQAPRPSDAFALALMIAQFPGSWLPQNSDQVVNQASAHFRLVSVSNGRLDYIETISQWRKRFRKFNFRKYRLYLSLIPRLLVQPSLRPLAAVFRKSPNRTCFQRELIDHYRFVFEKQ